jgi:hypothetical protein
MSEMRENLAAAITRRRFLTSSASGIGMAALAALLRQDGLLAAPAANPTAPKPPPFGGTAKSCIFVFQAGGSSHLELFDPKPELIKRSGERLPDSFTKTTRFSFLKPEQSLLMAPRAGFKRYGKCGMEMSELLPHIGGVADDIALVRSMHTGHFDHAPAELELSTGVNTPGRPSMGAWLSYGLGSESQNLPSYVVLLNDRGPVARSMAWGNAFLPSIHAGVLFRSTGEPVLNLENPAGVSAEIQRRQIESVSKLNRLRFDHTRDPEVNSKIAAYELAFRMQSAAPELIDLSGESAETRELYGVDRAGEMGAYSTNCLLARRLVERGVRFVSIFQRKWDQHKELDKDLRANCRTVDQPIAALIKDLKRRGMLDSTVVVWGTEFGRTPLTENTAPTDPAAGRDHHPYGFSVFLAGGGIKGGQTIGSTDDFGWHAVEDKVHVNDFHATLLQLFGLDHLKLTYRYKGLDFRLTDVAGNVVNELIG